MLAGTMAPYQTLYAHYQQKHVAEQPITEHQVAENDTDELHHKSFTDLWLCRTAQNNLLTLYATHYHHSKGSLWSL